jgi:hypothetical protein
VNGKIREQFLRLFIGDTWVDNDVVAFLPVNRGGDPVLVAELEGYNLDQ